MNGIQAVGAGQVTSGPGRPSQVAEQHQRLGKNVEALGNIVCNLEERLAVVVRGEQMVEASPGGPPQPVAHLVPMANDLRDKNNALESMADRLNNLFNRLEL